MENLVPSAQTLEKSSNSCNRNIQYKPGPEVKVKGIQAEKADLVTQDVNLHSARMDVQLPGVFDFFFILFFISLQNVLIFYDFFFTCFYKKSVSEYSDIGHWDYITWLKLLSR